MKKRKIIDTVFTMFTIILLILQSMTGVSEVLAQSNSLNDNSEPVKLSINYKHNNYTSDITVTQGDVFEVLVNTNTKEKIRLDIPSSVKYAGKEESEVSIEGETIVLNNSYEPKVHKLLFRADSSSNVMFKAYISDDKENKKIFISNALDVSIDAENSTNKETESNTNKETESNTNKETESNTNKETESNTNKETESNTNKETESNTNKETESNTNKETESNTNKETESNTNKETESNTNKETESNTNKETESNTNKETESNTEAKDVKEDPNNSIFSKKTEDPQNYYLINGDFEAKTKILIPPDSFRILPEQQIEGWKTTAEDHAIEIVRGTGGPNHHFHPQNGEKFAEINANVPGELHQLVKTIPGTTMEWQLFHAGRDKPDTMSINIGTAEDHPSVKKVTSQDRQWTKYNGKYTVPQGQYVTYFGFESINSTDPSHGNYIDNITFKLPKGVDAIKRVDKVKAKVGDTLTYTIEAWNSGVGDTTATIEDALQSDYISYVPETTKIEGVSQKDSTIWTEGNLKINNLELKQEQHKLITFDVKIKDRAKDQKIENKATIIDDKTNTKKETPVVTTVIDAPEMALTKKVDKDKAKVGDTLTYTIEANNSGKADWKGLIHDALPDNVVSYTANTTTVNGKQIADKDIWKANELTYNTTVKAKDKVTITFQVKVNEVARHKTINNIADGGDKNDPDNPKPTPPVPTVIDAPEMALTKKVDKDKAKVGDTLTYTIEANNSGEADWKGLIHDALPDNVVSYTANTTTVNGKQIADKDIWKANELTYNTTVKAKDKVTITFQVKVNEVARHKTINNIADGGDKNDPDNPKPTPPVPTVIDAPEMALTKKVDKDKAKVGDTLTYTIEANNSGEADWKGLIHDALPDNVVSYTANTTTVNGKQIADKDIWKANELTYNTTVKAKDKVTITFQVKVNEVARHKTINNIADGGDKNDPDNPKPTPPVPTVIDAPEMALTKKVDKDKAKVGDTLTYTIEANNSGEADWKGLIHDALPDNVVSYTANTTTVNGKQIADKDIWKANELTYNTTVKAKDKVTITFQVKVNEVARHKTINNIADGGDKNDPDNPKPTPPVPTVIDAPEMALTKKVDKDKAKVGDTLTYTIEANNSGEADWKGLIHDALPDNVVSYTANTTTVNGKQIADKDIWKANELTYNTTVKAKDKVTITFQVKVNEVARHKTINNIADGGDKNDPDNPKPTPPVPTVIDAPEMALTKKVDKDKAKVGDTLTYTIEANNSGKADWKGLIHDALPDNVVSYTANTTTVNGKQIADKDIWKANELTYNTTVKAKDKVTITFQVKVNEVARHKTINNIADGGDKNDPDNPKPTPPVPTVIDAPEMALTKKVDKDKAKVGDTLTYTIEANNSGEADWKGLIHDALPDNVVSYTANTTTVNGKQIADKDIWKANELTYNTTVKVKDKVTITFQVKVNEVARHKTINNIADGGDKNDPDNPKPTPPVPTVIDAPEMALTKKVDKDKAKVGDTLTYTIEANNSGEADWKGLIHDALPDNIVSYTANTTTVNGKQIADKDIWKANELTYNTTVKAKDKVTITFQVKVNEVARHKTINNIADGGDKNDPDNPKPTPPVPTVIDAPEMALTKKVDKDKAKVGDTLTYTIEANNSGEADWKGLIHDALPDNVVSYTANTTTVNGKQIADKDIWKANELTYNTTVKAKDKVTITFQVKVNEVARHKTINNIADGGDKNDPDNPKPTPPVPTVIDAPEMALTKKVDKDKAKVGDTLTYTIEANNSGKADWKGLIHDALPDNVVSYTANTTTVNGKQIADKDIWKANELTYNTTVKAKDKVTITFQVKVNEVARHKTINNIADGGDKNDPDNPKPTPPVPTVIDAPEMALTKKVDKDKAKVGDTLTYTIEANNSGEADWKGLIHDALPDNFVSYTANTTTVNGKQIADKDIWKANELTYNTTVKAKDKVTITFQVKVNEVARHKTINNIADGGDKNDPDNPKPTPPVPTVIDAPEMALTKKVDKDKAKVGDTLTYTIEANNSGEADWKGLIHDALPDNVVSYTANTTTVNGKQIADKDIWKANELTYNTTVKAKDKVTITFQVKVNEVARHKTINNIADGGDKNDPDNPKPTPPVPTVIDAPEMALTKKVDKDKAKVGDTLTYTIEANNSGEADWKGLIHDALPDNVVSYTANTTTVNGKQIADKDIWKANELTYNTTVKAKDKVTITFQVKVNEVARHKTINNIADGGDKNDPDNPKPTPPVPTVIDAPEMALTKKVDKDKAKVGDTLTYTIEANNSGKADWKGLIHDALPDNVVSYTANTTTVNGKQIADKDIWKANELTYNTTVKAKDKVTITFQVKVNEVARHKTINNIADGGDKNDPDNPKPTPPVPTVIDAPEMALTKKVDKDKAKVGDTLTYTIEANNSGKADWKGLIHDALPDNVVSYTANTTTVNGKQIADKDIWKANELTYNTTVKAKDKVTITFQVKVNEVARHKTINNIADGGDKNDPDNPKPTPPVPTVIDAPEMALTKKVDKDKAKVGDTLTYTIEANNSGEADWKGLIHDALPDNVVSYTANTTTVNGKQIADKDIWKANELTYNTTVKAKDKVTITFQVKVNEVARHKTINNIADGGDKNDPDNPKPTPPVPTVIDAPEMALTKKVDKDKAKVGDTLTYTIEANNSGEADWKGLIHDALPDNVVSYTANTTTVNGKQIADKDIWKANELTYNTTVKAKDKVTITFQVKVNEVARHKTINNIADGGDKNDPDNPKPTPPVPTVIDAPEMALTKKVDKDKAKVGDTLTYTIEANNSGEADWKGLIHDALPDNVVSYTANTTTVNGKQIADKDIWKANELTYNTTVKAKDKVTITFQVKVNEVARHKTINNIADGGDKNDPDNPKPTPPVPTVIDAPEMALTKKVDKDKAKVGDTLTYTIEANNSGEADWKGLIHDALPDNFVSYTANTTTVNGKQIADKDIWKANELTYNTTVKAKDKVTITFQVKVNEVARHKTINNIADGGDKNDPDNPKPTPPVPTVIDAPEMALTKKVDKDKAKVGDTLTYTIEANNSGEADWKGLIHDALPDNVVSYTANTTTVNGKQIADKDIWKANELTYNTTVKAKDKVTITFQVKVNEVARHKTINNIADGGDKNDPDNPKPTPPVPTVIDAPEMALTKKVDKDKAKVGDTLTYTIEANNSGEADWKGLIHDALPDNVVSYTANTTTVNGKQIADKDIWKANELTYNTTVKAKDKVTITFQVKVNEVARHKTINNIADGGDKNDPDNPKPTPPVPTVIDAPEMALTKKVDKDKAKVGDTLTYTIEANNSGKADWKGLIHDALPDNVVSYTANTTTVNGKQIADKDIWKANELTYNTTVKAKDKVTITFQVKVNEVARHKTINNIADGGDKNDPDNPKPTPPVPTVIDAPEMALTKKVDKDKAKVGDTLTYTIEANNSGKADWKGLIHDALPDNVVSYTANTTTVNGKQIADKDIWKANELTYNTTVKAKDKVTITFQVKVNEVARHKTINNIADGGDKNDPDNPKPTPPVPTVIDAPESSGLIPQTGEQFDYLLIVIGLILIISCVYILYNEKRRK